MSGLRFLLDTNVLLGMMKPALPYLALDRQIEDSAIALRRQRRIKLPDAVIAATALTHGLELLTLDEGLSAVMASAR